MAASRNDIDGSTDGGIEDAPAEVHLELPADVAYASVLRTLTASLAARLDFTVDDIEDLRIAVSEAAAMVLDESDPTDADGRPAALDALIALSPRRMSVTLAAPAAAPNSPDYESFGWQVLATLAAEASIESAPGRYAVRLVVQSSLQP